MDDCHDRHFNPYLRGYWDMSQVPYIKVNELTLAYGDYVVMKDLNFQINKGDIFIIMGPSGCGKSSLLRALTGLIPVPKGEIIINGFDIQKQPVKAKQTIGYTSDDHSIYEKLGGRECLDYMGSLFNVSKANKEKYIRYYANKFDIEYALDKQISSYSHGMKQKVCLVASLLHQPKLWILDEPMLGLDPQTKKIVMDYIREYADKGNSVLFSSHDIYTVSQICDYVAIINKGHLVDLIDMKHTIYKKTQDLEKHFMDLTKQSNSDDEPEPEK